MMMMYDIGGNEYINLLCIAEIRDNALRMNNNEDWYELDPDMMEDIKYMILPKFLMNGD